VGCDLSIELEQRIALAYADGGHWLDHQHFGTALKRWGPELARMDEDAKEYLREEIAAQNLLLLLLLMMCLWQTSVPAHVFAVGCW